MTELPAHEGTVVGGRYRVERLVGQGGMGSVWAGRHLTLKRQVAIKFIHPHLANSADALRRFDTEAKAAAKIKSRHAVSVFDHGVTEDGQPYIVMEYLEGESLEHKIRRVGKIPLPEVVSIVEQAALALTAAHEQGVIHRDLKPDNIFLATEREASDFGYVVKLVDFGIAKMVEDEAASGAAATQAGVVLGTPHYMSPEALMASAPVGRASDVWSLGACAFTAATGRLPFEGDAIGDVVLKVCAAPLPQPSKVAPELPRAFDEWFKKACARSLSDRFPTPAEAAAALADLRGWEQRRREGSAYELRGVAPVGDDALLAPSASQRGLLLAGGLAGASLMLAALGYYVMNRTRTADQQAAAAAESARAIIEAENERRLREAEAAFWGEQDAGARSEAPASAARETKKPRPR